MSFAHSFRRHADPPLGRLCPGARRQPAAPAGKPTIPQVCTNCHQAAAGPARRACSRPSRSSRQSIQLKIDAGTEILRFDPKTLKVIDAGDAKTADAPARPRQGPRSAHRIRREGRRQDRHADLVQGPDQDRPREARHYDERRQAGERTAPRRAATRWSTRGPLPRVQEGTIPTAINLPLPRASTSSPIACPRTRPRA